MKDYSGLLAQLKNRIPATKEARAEFFASFAKLARDTLDISELPAVVEEIKLSDLVNQPLAVAQATFRRAVLTNVNNKPRNFEQLTKLEKPSLVVFFEYLFFELEEWVRYLENLFAGTTVGKDGERHLTADEFVLSRAYVRSWNIKLANPPAVFASIDTGRLGYVTPAQCWDWIVKEQVNLLDNAVKYQLAKGDLAARSQDYYRQVIEAGEDRLHNRDKRAEWMKKYARTKPDELTLEEATELAIQELGLSELLSDPRPLCKFCFDYTLSLLAASVESPRSPNDRRSTRNVVMRTTLDASSLYRYLLQVNTQLFCAETGAGNKLSIISTHDGHANFEAFVAFSNHIEEAAKLADEMSKNKRTPAEVSQARVRAAETVFDKINLSGSGFISFYELFEYLMTERIQPDRISR